MSSYNRVLSISFWKIPGFDCFICKMMLLNVLSALFSSTKTLNQRVSFAVAQRRLWMLADKMGSSELFATKSIPVNFQSINRSKVVTQMNQVPRQKMNINRSSHCLCVAYLTQKDYSHEGKHMRCQNQTQMVTGLIMTWLAILNLKCHLCWRNSLSVKAPWQRSDNVMDSFTKMS
jgi:hypothetical protein